MRARALFVLSFDLNRVFAGQGALPSSSDRTESRAVLAVGDQYDRVWRWQTHDPDANGRWAFNDIGKEMAASCRIPIDILAGAGPGGDEHTCPAEVSRH